MNIQTKLISENYKIVLAELSVNGHKGVLTLSQKPSQARTDTAHITVKLDGEKSVNQKINTMVDFENLKDYLEEFYINAEYVKDWKI